MIQSIEKHLDKFFLRQVVFCIEGQKPLKAGKLILYKFKDFYFKITLKDGNTTKTLELPYPFAWEVIDQNCLKFHYTLNAFSQNNTDLLIKSKLLIPEKKTKIYNSTITLSATDEPN